MVQLQIALTNEHFAYIQRLQQTKQASADQVLAELIARMIQTDRAWHETLANDPVATLFGTLDDGLAPEENIDALIYTLP
jgi:hypothetical protein